MSGAAHPFIAHYCPACNCLCECRTATVSAGPEEEEIVNGCTHDCEAAELEREGTYKPGHSGGFPF